MATRYLTPRNWINTFSVSTYRSSNDILLFRISVFNCLFSLSLNKLGAGFTSPKRVVTIDTNGISHTKLGETDGN